MTTIDRPAARYGSEQPRRTSGTSGKVVAVVAVILVALIVVFLGRYVMQRQAQPISATLVSHERVDDTTSRVWFDVQRDDSAIDVPSYCIITSLNYDMTEIGRRDVVIPPGGEKQMRMHVDIPVGDQPVSGGVYGCSTTFPSYLDTEAAHTAAR
ncbi:DUF4307 domain-containing protein [Corynebacterium genitalium ATCC 33030]|uniref:Uncharacterized protein n=1 Tax=Corynebacterium genitalium ATCC 33030 TaxID=585529 RepID=D7WDY8_9CORY|nr:DUF4307 domain-containing protein [Corynebacterium genitalium]EFK54369.1 hypothetical protein HMPREF0291_12026 [Corynebacterium genitalium ATCC 33030]UUA90133.1 DUF4307 domain-containing protein [Corynebacterium genitalium ATCC 33030]